ncbi:MAG: hypothetical protein ABIY52_05395 [Gemmatimonadaceae bacterium]
MVGMNQVWRACAAAFGLLAALSLAGALLALAMWVFEQGAPGGFPLSAAIAAGLGAFGVACVFAHRAAKANALRWPQDESSPRAA